MPAARRNRLHSRWLTVSTDAGKRFSHLDDPIDFEEGCQKIAPACVFRFISKQLGAFIRVFQSTNNQRSPRSPATSPWLGPSVQVRAGAPISTEEMEPNVIGRLCCGRRLGLIL